VSSASYLPPNIKCSVSTCHHFRSAGSELERVPRGERSSIKLNWGGHPSSNDGGMECVDYSGVEIRSLLPQDCKAGEANVWKVYQGDKPGVPNGDRCRTS